MLCSAWSRAIRIRVGKRPGGSPEFKSGVWSNKIGQQGTDDIFIYLYLMISEISL